MKNDQLSNSTFYTDGFNDGIRGKKAAPPAPYSFNGQTTNVYASEYLQGWVDGSRELREHNATMPDEATQGISDANIDQHFC